MSKQVLNKATYGGINKQFEKTSKNTIIVRGYFTSDNRDEVGDIITRRATEKAIPAYKQWGNIRLLHTPKPVAKVRKISVEDGLEWNEVEIEVIDPETVFMVENGLLGALSVGILVDFDHIDFMADGGLIINEYQLAEISLVDHPANYDAKLKDMVLDHDARMYALQYGFGALGNNYGGLKDMAKQKELETQVTDEVPIVEPVVEEKDLKLEIPAEEVPAEEPEIVEPVSEELVEEPVAEEEEIIEEKLVEEPAPAIEEEVSEDKSEEEKSEEPEYVADLRKSIEQISALLDELRAKVIVEPVAVVESQTSEEKEIAVEDDKDAIIKKLTDKLTEKSARIEALEMQLGELPAERKGLVDEKASVIESQETVEAPKDLKSVLTNYFKTK